MINPTQLRRTASASNTGFGTIDPTSLFNADAWSQNEDDLSFTAPSPPDHLVAAGSAMQRGRRIVSESELQHDPKTPLRKGRGQSLSSGSLSGIVTPQSVNRSFSVASLPFTPGPGQQQQHPLMSPMDTPLATPSEDNFENFFDLSTEPKMNWNFQFDFPAKLGDSTLVATAGSIGSISEQPDFSADNSSIFQDGSFLAADAYLDPKAMYSARSSSVLSSLDGTYESYDNFGRSMSVSSMKSPPHSSRNSRSASLNRIQGLHYGFNISVNPQQVSVNAGSKSPLTMVASGSGVNPFYNPPSYLRRTRSEACEVGEGPLSSQWSMKSSTDAGVGVFDLANHKQVAHPERANTKNTDEESTEQPGLGASLVILGDDAKTEHSTGSVKGKILTRADSTASAASFGAEEKPYTCETCDKSFRRMEHLRRHMKTHTMERPYPCTVAGCERKFSRTDNLKAHILTHAKKSGRNIYVEGLAERHDIKPVKRRKSRKSSTSEIIV